MKMKYIVPEAEIADFQVMDHLLAPHPDDDDRSRGADRSGGGILEGSSGYDDDRG